MEFFPTSENCTSNPTYTIPFSFTILVRASKRQINSNNNASTSPDPNERILVLAAFSKAERDGWLQALKTALGHCGSNNDGNDNVNLGLPTVTARLFNSLGSEEMLISSGGTEIVPRAVGVATESGNSNSATTTSHNYRSNALSHVCWHRIHSVDAEEVLGIEKVRFSNFIFIPLWFRS